MITCVWFCPIFVTAIKGVHKGVQDVPAEREQVEELLEEFEWIENKDGNW